MFKKPTNDASQTLAKQPTVSFAQGAKPEQQQTRSQREPMPRAEQQQSSKELLLAEADMVDPFNAPSPEYKKKSTLVTTRPDLRNTQGVQENERVMIIGCGTSLRGEVSHCDLVRIEGNAHIVVAQVTMLEVSGTGTLNGNAQVQDAHVYGTIEGDLYVTGRLVVYSGGKILGHVIYNTLEIKEGGEILGTMEKSQVIDKPSSHHKSPQHNSAHNAPASSAYSATYQDTYAEYAVEKPDFSSQFFGSST